MQGQACEWGVDKLVFLFGNSGLAGNILPLSSYLPHMGETLGKLLLYYAFMIRVYLASPMLWERSAFHLMLLDLNMEIAGEAGDWSTTLAEVPICHTDMLLADWELLPNAFNAALDELRRTCPKALVIVLISCLETRQQAALLVSADVFISKGERPERVAEHLRAAAAKIRT